MSLIRSTLWSSTITSPMCTTTEISTDGDGHIDDLGTTTLTSYTTTLTNTINLPSPSRDVYYATNYVDSMCEQELMSFEQLLVDKGYELEFLDELPKESQERPKVYIK